MIKALLLFILLTSLAGCHAAEKLPPPPETELREIISGSAFLTPETRAMQADEFENPGYLWVEKGKALFDRTVEDGPSCQDCHGQTLQGIAASFPKMDEATGKLINLEGQINFCRERHQNSEPLSYESDELLSLTAFIAEESRGYPIDVSVSGAARPHFESGKSYFYTKRGQFNFSCSQCHDANWGQKLRGDTISQGHLNGFPAYRLEWESLGSSHRRLRDCDTGVRAEPLPFGDQTYIDVELYLAHRAQGLSSESPAIRR